MDKDIARHVAKLAFQKSAELGNLIPFVKEFCDEREYKAYSLAIANVSATINLEIMQRVFSDYPELKEEFESQLRKYGKII